MDEFIKIIKKRMINNGRDDFVNYLAEILNISKQAASAKLNGKSRFTLQDITSLNTVLHFNPDELDLLVKIKGA